MTKVFLNIISLSSKDNTYKFAMARFLIDYIRDHTNKKTHIEFPVIAKYFLRYYWPQICKLKIKHAPQVQKKPEIVTIIEKEFPKSYYPQTFDKITQEEPQKIQNCIDKIVKKCFHNVIWRFQKINVGGAIESKIFFDYKITREINPNKKYIDLDYGLYLNSDSIKFFKKYNTFLLKAVVLEWARFLEKLNIGLPKIIEKTEKIEIKRGSLKKYEQKLKPLCKKCFYCNALLEEQPKIEVEHVIPFDYIAEDDIWNLTLVCKRCNCKKLGALPPQRYIDALITRNQKYCELIPDMKKSFERLWGGPR